MSALSPEKTSICIFPAIRSVRDSSLSGDITICTGVISTVSPGAAAAAFIVSFEAYSGSRLISAFRSVSAVDMLLVIFTAFITGT